MSKDIRFLDYTNPMTKLVDWVPSSNSLIFVENPTTREWIFEKLKETFKVEIILEGSTNQFPCVLGISRPLLGKLVVEQIAPETMMARLNVLSRAFQKP